MKKERYLLPLILILVWQGLSSVQVIPSYKLPSPVEIVLGFRDILIVGVPPGHLLHNHMLYSLYRVALGYAVAALLAIPLGLLMGWSPGLLRMIRPLFELVRPIPPLAWIPIAILWFGIGIKSAAFIIFLGAFFPILLNTISGVLSINPILIEAARTLHAKEKDIFFKVLLPGAVPSIFVGMRIGIGIGWMTLVAAEFTGVKEGFGLGYMIMTARDIQRPDEILAGMLVIGVIGLLIDIGLRAIESKTIKWQ
ncbi:MAG: ABC transporter permease [Deltaproteobacteria bacterium RBG_19FT_COMBO_46_12]|jgi:ABC-type nitrate/sulfonate/bicarbonate transport system permease component|nr:ABC transporter permease [Syntrophaceae bacterium]OGP98466.1 MAG: ABC transporter permease [Deltaproteobacteria bacterium RBG_19FT_COMBO_46_12]